jgi:hypothetical protein
MKEAVKKTTRSVVAAKEELKGIFLRLKTQYADSLMEELKKCSPEAFRILIIELLDTKDSPIYLTIHQPGAKIHIKLLRGRKRRIGLSQVLSFVDACPEPVPSLTAIIGTSGYTDQLWEEAKKINTRLMDLAELTEPILPDAFPFSGRHHPAAEKNIVFVP